MKKEENIRIGAQIRKARRNHGYTQEQLSELIGVTPQYLSDLERGRVGTSITTLRRICSVLHVSSDFILFSETRPGTNPDSAENGFDTSLIFEQIQSLPDGHRILLKQYLSLLESIPGSSGSSDAAMPSDASDIPAPPKKTGQ